MAQLSGLMNFLRFRGERLEILQVLLINPSFASISLFLLQKCAEQQGAISEERRYLEEAARKKVRLQR